MHWGYVGRRRIIQYLVEKICPTLLSGLFLNAEDFRLESQQSALLGE